MSTPLSPEAWRRPAWPRALGGLAFWLLVSPALGQPFNHAPAPDAERTRLLAQQAELRVRFDAEEQACRDRFVVTACVEGVQQRRRETLAPVGEKLLQLNEAERLRRATIRQQAVAEKGRVQAERMAERTAERREAAEAAAAAASSASAPRARQRMLPPAARLAEAPSMPGRDSEAARRETDAAERVRQAQRRQAQVAENQARVARRLAEREARKQPLQPLPAAGNASAPR